jgi:hypothetical protein
MFNGVPDKLVFQGIASAPVYLSGRPLGTSGALNDAMWFSSVDQSPRWRFQVCLCTITSESSAARKLSRNASGSSDARFCQGAKLGEPLCARLINLFERGRWRLRRMRANGYRNSIFFCLQAADCGFLNRIKGKR